MAGFTFGTSLSPCDPQIVGVHWHQFGDEPTACPFDGEDSQVGWVDCCDTSYSETRAAK